jgi:hypothetical protein
MVGSNPLPREKFHGTVAAACFLAVPVSEKKLHVRMSDTGHKLSDGLPDQDQTP